MFTIDHNKLTMISHIHTIIVQKTIFLPTRSEKQMRNRDKESTTKKVSFWRKYRRNVAVSFMIAVAFFFIFFQVAYRWFYKMAVQKQEDAFYRLDAQLDKSTDGKSVADSVSRVRLKLSILSEQDVGRAQYTLVDEVTDEVVADSTRAPFLVLKDKSLPENEQETKIYPFGSDILEALRKYDIRYEDRLYYPAGLKDVEFLYKLGTDFYYFDVEDAYIDGEDVYLGKMKAETYRNETEALGENEMVSLDFTPSGAKDMMRCAKPDYTLMFIVVGDTSSNTPEFDDMPDLTEASANLDSTSVTSSTLFCPGVVTFKGKHRYIDSAGKPYVVNYVSAVDFANLYWCVIPVCFIICVLVLIISMVAGIKINNREKLM